MTPVEAAWVRRHVWTNAMRLDAADKSEGFVVDFWKCACQWGLSAWCQPGDGHHWCGPQESRPQWETLICEPSGVHPVRSPAMGEQRLAVVWLADRTCRRICPCACHPLTYQLVPLFGLAATP